MKNDIAQLIAECIAKALESINKSGSAAIEAPASINVERARDPQHGDLASNVAMTLAKSAGMPPRKLAELIVEHFPGSEFVEAVEIAGPGFINFRLAAGVTQQVVTTVLEQGERFGHVEPNSREKVLVEFISANPTGPLHVGHGRHAAYGASVSSILTAAGYNVHREYYVNDAGRQMDILAVSLWLRYLSKRGEAITFPANGYRGDYILDIAKDLQEKYGDQFHRSAEKILENLPPDEPDGGDKDDYIDAIGARARELLGDDYALVQDMVLNSILDDIKQDLEEFGVGLTSGFPNVHSLAPAWCSRPWRNYRPTRACSRKTGHCGSKPPTMAMIRIGSCVVPMAPIPILPPILPIT